MRERLGAWLVAALRREAVPLGLLAGMGGLLAYSLDQAGWVAGSHLGIGLAAALALGALLARSRFTGRASLAYAMLMLLAGAAQHVGRVLPGPGQLWAAPGEWVWTLHLRTLTLAQRVAGWGATLRAGAAVQDTGLFLGLASLAAWGAALWLAWGALRRQQGLAAALPVGVLLAINLHLSGQPWGFLLVYGVLAVGLVAQTRYLSLQTDWDRRGLDYPGEMGLDWGSAAAGLMLGVALLGAAAPLVGTPAGWHLMAQVVEASRRQAAETAEQLFSGVTPPRTSPVLRANTPDLGRIGAPIDQSREAIMWVRVSDPPPVVPEYGLERTTTSPPQHYWRSALFATYTGEGWEPLAGGEARRPAADPGDAPAGRYPLRQQFEIVAEHGQALFAVNVPVTTSSGAELVALPDEATLLVSGPASTYSVLSWATRATEAELRAAPAVWPEAAITYLQLPETLPGRVRDLAAEIVRGAGNPYDQALRLQNYLRANYAYRLDVPQPPDGRDAVDYFLFEAPAGFCTYYASALAVMLRTQGVPARVASGYAMGEYDPASGAYRVPGAAAHAWVEVFFPGYGWVEFEPTPARSAFARDPGAEQAAATVLAPAASSPGAATVQGYWPIWAAVVIGLGAGAGWWLARWAPRRAATPTGRALRLYARLRQSLARAGLGAPPSLTPDEYQAGTAPWLAGHPPVAAALAQATRLHEQAAYSARPVARDEVAAAERRWGLARRAWLRLWLRQRRSGARRRG